MNITAIVEVVVGSGLGTAIVGALFKHRFERELEVQKAFLARASSVHDRQVDVLCAIYHWLWETHAYLQLMTSSLRVAGEQENEYPRKFAEAAIHARDEFFGRRLLVPSELAVKCDGFFKKLFEGQLQLGFANDPMVIETGQRKQFWDRAATIAHSELPALLGDIEASARAVIHGSSAPSSG